MWGRGRGGLREKRAVATGSVENEHRNTKRTCKTNRYSPVKHNHVNHYKFRYKQTTIRPATIPNTLSKVQIVLVIWGPT